ncbi:hypothetical protein [Bradyrhizobium neotropicale]|uniref:hypothetical protein n=1 Tax=Bradyrhizobium neotropicale TaxID=1497615 RepID=UPI001FEEB625|nr:hypothetical protein [Bradyrhizobium neotropicale]
MLIERSKAREKVRVHRTWKAASVAVVKCQPGVSTKCRHKALRRRARTGFTGAMRLHLIAMLAPHVGLTGSGTAIKHPQSSRESRGLCLWKAVSARAAQPKDGPSSRGPHRPWMVEDLSEIVELIGAHCIRMQARRVRTAGRGAAMDQTEHRRRACRRRKRNLLPTGAVDRQIGAFRACLRRPFTVRGLGKTIEAIPHEADMMLCQVEVESRGGTIERPPARSRVQSTGMPDPFWLGGIWGRDGAQMRLHIRIRRSLIEPPVRQHTVRLKSRVRKSSHGVPSATSTVSKQVGSHPTLNRSPDQMADRGGLATMPTAGTLAV